MANPWAGEVALVIDGERREMRLTLGALAEMEAALGAGSLVDLVARFETGAFSSGDVLAVIVAGLRGGGWRLRASECVLGHRDEALPQRGDPMTGLRPAADVRIGETSGGGDRR